PIAWEQMCAPMQGAVLGALRYEGLARTNQEGIDLIRRGRVRFAPNHHYGAVGPMTGITTPSMPVFVVENTRFGNRAYCTINEGIGKVMRFGANDATVIERLHWIAGTLAPALAGAIRGRSEPINLKVIMAQALIMGDEMHQRNVAATSLFIRTLMPFLARERLDPQVLAAVTDFLTANDQFFLNLAMAAGKAILDPARGVEGSTLVTAMARNGHEFGLQVSGLGEEWFTAPVNTPAGLFFPGFKPEDANPDMGDSAILETTGLGGFAMIAAPAVVRFVGAGTLADAKHYTLEMAEITEGPHPAWLLPNLDFQGTPTGIDIRKVVETGILPVINTGIAHREAGIGQVGAGVVQAPLRCFHKALEAFVKTYAP
ncbi:MAG: DUF1116 domain-containing protein, partial [Candidatus Methylomirabilales bacterium]